MTITETFKTSIQALVTIAAVWGGFAYFVTPLKLEIEKINDPNGGYQKVVENSVLSAMERMELKDTIVRLEVGKEFKQLLDAQAKQNQLLIQEIRNQTKELRNQTKELSAGLDRIQKSDIPN